MKKEITEILLKIRDRITDDSDMVWTKFNKPDELRQEIDSFILRIEQEDKEVLKEISFYFAPTAIFQEHSINNDWSDECIKLAEQFDTIYKKYYSE